MTIRQYQCSDCRNVFDKRNQVKMLNGECVCKKCNSKRTKNKRDILLHTVIGVRRRKDLEKERKEKREKKEKERKEQEEEEPRIKGAKPRKRSIRKYSSKGMYITREEKNILYRKLKSMGLSNEAIKNRIGKSVEKIKEITMKLRLKNKTEEEINNKFKEEFAKLCEEER